MRCLAKSVPECNLPTLKETRGEMYGHSDSLHVDRDGAIQLSPPTPITACILPSTPHPTPFLSTPAVSSQLHLPIDFTATPRHALFIAARPRSGVYHSEGQRRGVRPSFEPAIPLCAPASDFRQEEWQPERQTDYQPTPTLPSDPVPEWTVASSEERQIVIRNACTARGLVIQNNNRRTAF